MPDILITPPTITAGLPTPARTLILTRNGSQIDLSAISQPVIDAVSETVIGGVYPSPWNSVLEAAWQAANGIGSPASITRTLTIPADPGEPVDPPGDDLVIYLSDGTARADVDPSEDVVFTIDPPHIHAGTYTLTPAMLSDMAQGPICLAVPEIALDAAGESLTVTRIGLWAYDADLGEMAITRRWHKNGAAIPDQVSQTLAIADHRGQPLQHVERAVQPGLERLAASSAVTLPELGGFDTFEAPDGTSILAFVGPSGFGWLTDNTAARAVITGNTLRSNSNANYRYVYRTDDRAPDQYAEGVVIPRNGAASSGGVGLAVRISSNAAIGYGARFSGTAWQIQVVGAPSVPASYPAGAEVFARLEAQDVAEGVRLRFYVDGALLQEYVDTRPERLLSGRAGVMVHSADPDLTFTRLKTFNAGDL